MYVRTNYTISSHQEHENLDEEDGDENEDGDGYGDDKISRCKYDLHPELEIQNAVLGR